MLGDRLKEERQRLGLTQPVFAEYAAAKKRTLIDWEKGVSSPTVLQLQSLATIGADVIYILTGARLSSDLVERLTEMLRVTFKAEPNGGPITASAYKSVLETSANAVAERGSEYLLSSEQALLDDYRACNEAGKKALEATASIMAQQAASEKGT